MKVLIDTNVVINFLMDPEQINSDGEFKYDTLTMKAAIKRQFIACISASAITDIAYVLTRSLRDANKNKKTEEKLSNKQIIETANNKVMLLLKRVNILAVSEREIYEAFFGNWKDKEDAVQYFAAKNNDVNIIVTRNTKDFKSSEIPVYTPEEFIKKFQLN